MINTAFPTRIRSGSAAVCCTGVRSVFPYWPRTCRWVHAGNRQYLVCSLWLLAASSGCCVLRLAGGALPLHFSGLGSFSAKSTLFLRSRPAWRAYYPTISRWSAPCVFSGRSPRCPDLQHHTSSSHVATCGDNRGWLLVPISLVRFLYPQCFSAANRL